MTRAFARLDLPTYYYMCFNFNSVWTILYTFFCPYNCVNNACWHIWACMLTIFLHRSVLIGLEWQHQSYTTEIDITNQNVDFVYMELPLPGHMNVSSHLHAMMSTFSNLHSAEMVDIDIYDIHFLVLCWQAYWYIWDKLHRQFFSVTTCMLQQWNKLPINSKFPLCRLNSIYK